MTARLTLKEKREHKIDRARELLRGHAMSTTGLAESMKASWTTAHDIIDELLHTGEIVRQDGKHGWNRTATTVYAWADAAPVVEDAPTRHRFNPARWCVEDSGSEA